MSQKNQLRQKIKKLKYKIEKEEKLNACLKTEVQQLHKIDRMDLGSDRVLKKINFKLQQKGMEMTDWTRCLPYQDQIDTHHLLETGKVLGLGLDREEYDLLLNFMADDLSPVLNEEQFKNQCNRSGIWIKE